MPPPPLEHDYIGLSEVFSGESPDKLSAAEDGDGAASAAVLNLKQTELRLGLPGSPPFTVAVDAPAVSLTLGLPKSYGSGVKRGFSDAVDGDSGEWGAAQKEGPEVVQSGKGGGGFFSRRGENGGGKLVSAETAGSASKDLGGAANAAPAAKVQVVGWPPIRSYRKNTMASNTIKNKEDGKGKNEQECLYVKVGMDGAPYLRKVDLKMHSNYKELSSALEKMFTCFTVGQCSSNGTQCRERLTESPMMDFLKGSEYVLTYEDKDGDWMLVGDVPWDMFTDSCRRLRIMKGSDAIGIAPRAMEKSKTRN